MSHFAILVLWIIPAHNQSGSARSWRAKQGTTQRTMLLFYSQGKSLL